MVDSFTVLLFRCELDHVSSAFTFESGFAVGEIWCFYRGDVPVSAEPWKFSIDAQFFFGKCTVSHVSPFKHGVTLGYLWSILGVDASLPEGG